MNIGNVANLNLDGNVSNVLSGTGTWIAAGGGGGSGTVTSVGTTGSGLGFSLSGGPITTTGSVNLVTPTSSALRTSLNIGNVANLNLDGNVSNVLAGDGTFVALSTGGSGTVTQVVGNGSGLGFSLGGTVTTTGNITLVAPTASDLRTSLTIGNVANLNLDGNVANVLSGTGTWVKNLTDPAGSNTEIQFNNSGVFGSSANFYYTNQLNVRGTTAPIIASRYSNTAATVNILARGRGDLTTPLQLEVNDLYGLAFFPYTGNGTTTLNGITGFPGNVASINARIDQLPGASGRCPSTSLVFSTTLQSSNIASTCLTLDSNTNATFANNVSVTGNVTTNGLLDINYATESVGIIGAQTGTYNFDLLSNSVQFSTSTSTGNIVVNMRGSSTVTANTMLAVGQSVVGTYIMTTGATAHTITSLQIDGSAQTIRWVGGSAPTANTNSTNAFSFTLIKTAATPTYIVLGSMTRYA